MKENQNLPRWTFEDAYVDFGDEKFIKAMQNAVSSVDKVHFATSKEEISLVHLVELYEKAFDEVSSLKAFCRCKLSDNTKDERVGAIEAKIQEQIAGLENAKRILFKKMQAFKDDDEIWREERLSHWKFAFLEYKNSWKNQIPDTDLKIYEAIKRSNFTPLYSFFTHLNNLISIDATDDTGASKTYGLPKCAGILKGSADAILRKNIFDGLSEHYDKYAALYADILNMLHGFRLNKFKEIGVDFLRPSYEQNKISAEAVSAMYAALEKSVSDIRQAVSLRASHFHQEKMSSCDLLAPSPYLNAKEIPYDKAINNVCEALGEVSDEIPEFIKMMLDNRWVEAEVRDDKAAGAFYTRFNDLKQPRVFSSYMGTQAHMIQQAHELGHAWHYWIMRDMPTIKTEFPMSLAEIASTFNEAILRDYLRKNSDDEISLFNILWQELKSAANFMLHISVRYDFEVSMIRARENKILTPNEIKELLAKAWNKWYGDSVKDMELFLPYFKPHFYKTDQYLYNYPYTIGYLISCFLVGEFKLKKEKFISVYKEFLRDSGSMSVDEILKKHFKKDIKSSEFWLECIKNALSYVDEFKALKTKP